MILCQGKYQFCCNESVIFCSDQLFVTTPLPPALGNLDRFLLCTAPKAQRKHPRIAFYKEREQCNLNIADLLGVMVVVLALICWFKSVPFHRAGESCLQITSA